MVFILFGCFEQHSLHCLSETFDELEEQQQQVTGTLRVDRNGWNPKFRPGNIPGHRVQRGTAFGASESSVLFRNTQIRASDGPAAVTPFRGSTFFP